MSLFVGKIRQFILLNFLLAILFIFFTFSNNVSANSSPLFLQTVSGISSSSNTITTSSAVSGGNNLYLASVAIVGDVNVNSITGMGLNWSLVKSLCTARGGTGITVYKAYGNASTGNVTVNLSGSATNAAVSVTSYSNVNSTNPIGSVIAANTNGINGNCSGGVDTDFYSVLINHNANSVIYGTGSIRLRDHTSGGGFTERSEVHNGSGGDIVGLFVQDMAVSTVDETEMMGSLNTATNWAVAAIEVVGSGGSSSTLPGDANGDNVVNGVDYVVWLNNFGKSTNKGPAEGDFNKDNVVNGVDYVVWLNNFGRTSTPSPTSTVQPTQTATSTPLPTPVPTNTPIPTATPTIPPITSSSGIWMSPQEIMALPTTGPAWQRVLSTANSNWGSANLSDNNALHDVNTLAGALVAVRNNDTAMRNKTIQGIQSAMVSPLARTLELSRGLQTYIIAADIIGYRTTEFETWVRNMVNADLTPHSGGSSLCNTSGVSFSCSGVGGVICTAYRSPNNWGGHARASAIAAALYLNDSAMLNKLSQAQRAFNGEAVSNHLYCQDTNWHADPNNKWGVNKVGSSIQGINVSGVIPEDWRRGGEFQWPPAPTGYMWEAMQGYVVSGVMLARAGLVPLNSGENATVRSMSMLYNINNPPASDDTWIPWVVNKYWGTTFPTSSADNPGKNMGWTDWTHQ